MPYSHAFEVHRNKEERVQRWVGYFMGAVREPNTRVLLDCGCGTGRFTVPLSTFFQEAYGVDRDDSMLAVAQEKDSGVHWLHADVLDIPLADHSVDVILASMLIEHLGPALNRFLVEAVRLLKDDGVLLIRTMLPDDIDATTWYGFSEKARMLEMGRTRGLEELEACFATNGFALCREASHLHVAESFPGNGVADRLASKCYEVQYHLNEREQDELIARAKSWENESVHEETMSSSLLVFVRRKRPDDELL